MGGYRVFGILPERPQKYVAELENVGFSPISPYKTRLFRLRRINILFFGEKNVPKKLVFNFSEKLLSTMNLRGGQGFRVFKRAGRLGQGGGGVRGPS